MNIKIKLLAALLLLTAPVAFGEDAEPAEPAGTPNIVCEEPVFDFGQMDNSSDVVHTFILKNAGDAPLEISNVRPSCGCTVANISNRSIAPGEQSEVTTRLSLKGRNGQQRKSITVHSNDPDQPQYTLHLQGIASVQVEVSPTRLFFGQAANDAVVTRSAEIRNRADEPLTITEVFSGSDSFTAELETLEEGKHYRVNISTKPPMPMGRVQTNVRVLTGNPKYATITIPSAITIIGDLAIAPSEIQLATSRDRGSVTRYIVVRPGKVQEFEIEKVEAPDDSIEVQVIAMGKNGYRIQLNNLRADPSLDGKEIKIKTNVESMQEFDIPIRVVDDMPTPAS